LTLFGPPLLSHCTHIYSAEQVNDDNNVALGPDLQKNLLKKNLKFIIRFS